MSGQELNSNGDDAVIPEEFSLWVLEWPDRLVVNGLWPGLPHTECLMDTLATGGAARRFGENFIALRPPVVAPMREERPEGSGVIVRSAVIPIWLSSWPVPEERIRTFVNTSSKELSVLYYGPESSLVSRVVADKLENQTPPMLTCIILPVDHVPTII